MDTYLSKIYGKINEMNSNNEHTEAKSNSYIYNKICKIEVFRNFTNN